jgi:hypothetical protein
VHEDSFVGRVAAYSNWLSHKEAAPACRALPSRRLVTWLRRACWFEAMPDRNWRRLPVASTACTNFGLHCRTSPGLRMHQCHRGEKLHRLAVALRAGRFTWDALPSMAAFQTGQGDCFGAGVVSGTPQVVASATRALDVHHASPTVASAIPTCQRCQRSQPAARNSSYRSSSRSLSG